MHVIGVGWGPEWIGWRLGIRFVSARIHALFAAGNLSLAQAMKTGFVAIVR